MSKHIPDEYFDGWFDGKKYLHDLDGKVGYMDHIILEDCNLCRGKLEKTLENAKEKCDNREVSLEEIRQRGAEAAAVRFMLSGNENGYRNMKEKVDKELKRLIRR